MARWPRTPGIPEWFGEREEDDGTVTHLLKAVEGDGGWWVTNGLAMIRVAEKPAELDVMDDETTRVVGSFFVVPTRPVVPVFPRVSARTTAHPPDVYDLMDYRCDVGEARVMLYLVALVEQLFPDCTWRAVEGWPQPVHAVKDGRVVAIVMPTSEQAEPQRAPAPPLTFAGAAHAVSLLAYGNREKMTEPRIRALRDGLADLLGAIAAVTVEDAEEPFAEAVVRRVAKVDKARERRHGDIDRRDALILLIRSITEPKATALALTDWQRLRFFTDPEHYQSPSANTRAQLRSANRAADRLEVDLRAAAEAFFTLDFTGPAPVPEPFGKVDPEGMKTVEDRPIPHRWEPLAGPEDIGDRGTTKCACGAWRKPNGDGFLYTAPRETEWTAVAPAHEPLPSRKSREAGGQLEDQEDAEGLFAGRALIKAVALAEARGLTGPGVAVLLRTRDEAAKTFGWEDGSAARGDTAEVATSFWGHARDEKPVRWDGAFTSREACVADGRATYREGASFWIQAGGHPDAASFVPDAQSIMEQMSETAADEADEAAEEYPDVTKEGQAELDALLETWARKHARPTFWIGMGEPEAIEPLPRALHVFYEPDAEEWVIAHDEADATAVYVATGADLLDDGMHWRKLDGAEVFKMDDAPEGTVAKTCAEWCTSNGRGYLGAANY